MHFQLRRCNKCKNYTLKEKCPNCKNDSISAHSAKFSPDDKYVRYRIIERYN
jgi:H/ACA ribonucleoprotein complex subunit 3